MHMADALVSPAVAGTMWVAGGMALGYGLHKVKKSMPEQQLPLMGVLGAFIFAAQMLNFTIPGTGSSGHITGALLLSALLGPAAGFITLALVLLIQALFFADGGLLAYGCNLINMGFYTCFLMYPLIFKPLVRYGGRKYLCPAALLTCVLGLQLGAFSVVLETLASGITALPFTTFLLLMQPIHLAIGAVEGAVTAAVLLFVWQARPEFFQERYGAATKNSLPLGSLVKVFAVAAVVCGGLFSLFASNNPDGLEWSIAKITGATELAGGGFWQQLAAGIQGATSLLAAYSVPGMTDSAWGTSVAGIVGGLVTCAVCLLAGKIITGRKAKKEVRD
jgi:cobalt/nickel transport system permease protein